MRQNGKPRSNPAETTCTWWAAHQRDPTQKGCTNPHCQFRHGFQSKAEPKAQPKVTSKEECTCWYYYGNSVIREDCPEHGVCEHFLRGTCKFGNDCKKLHQKYSNECSFFERFGECKRGTECWYKHSPKQVVAVQVVRPTAVHQPTHLDWLQYQLAHPNTTEHKFLQQWFSQVPEKEPVEKVSSNCWQCRKQFQADPSCDDYWCSDKCRSEYQDY